MAKLTVSYHEHLIKSLKNPVECAAYLNAALEDGDHRILLKALRNVAEARGGVSRLATRTKLARESLYRMLSAKGNPELDSLSRVVRHLGMRLAVVPYEVTRGAHR